MVAVLSGIIILHRIGTIVTMVGALVLPVLPKIFSQEADQQFMDRSYTFLLWLTRIGLMILAISGLWRLSYGIPSAFPIKALFITIDFYLYTKPPVKPVDSKYPEVSLLMALLLFATAGVGLYL